MHDRKKERKCVYVCVRVGEGHKEKERQKDRQTGTGRQTKYDLNKQQSYQSLLCYCLVEECSELLMDDQEEGIFIQVFIIVGHFLSKLPRCSSSKLQVKFWLIRTANPNIF